MTTGYVQPAGPPPLGTTSNFNDPVSFGPNLIACNVVLLVVSVLVVGARIISRTLLTDWRLGWDDYTMILALIGTAIFGAFVIVTTHFGLGKHIWDVPLSTYSPDYLWWIMATFAACPASYYFVKVSILFFYLRVFQLQPKLRYIIYALFLYTTIYYWLAFSTILGLCNAKNKHWDITAAMNCFAYGKLTLAIGGLDLLNDVIILGFPVPLVLKLHISWPQRIYLLFVFLAGLTATCACAIRVAFAAESRGTTDATMAQYKVVIMFCIEHYLALIAACMPTLGPIFRKLRPSHWKHVELGNKSLVNDEVDTFQHHWPHRNTSPDDSLMNGSLDLMGALSSDKNLTSPYWAKPKPHLSRHETPQSADMRWARSDANVSQKETSRNVMELQQQKIPR